MFFSNNDTACGGRGREGIASDRIGQYQLVLVIVLRIQATGTHELKRRLVVKGQESAVLVRAVLKTASPEETRSANHQKPA